MKPYDPLAAYNSVSVVQHPSVFKRIIAFLIDIFLLGFTVFAPLDTLLQTISRAPDFSTTYAAFTGNETLQTIITLLMVYIFTLVMLYFILLEYFLGQTAGMRFMKLKVEDIDGKKPTFWQCLVRNTVFLPLIPFILFWIIDPLYLFFTKQRLIEQLTKTRTVNTNYIKEQS